MERKRERKDIRKYRKLYHNVYNMGGVVVGSAVYMYHILHEGSLIEADYR